MTYENKPSYGVFASLYLGLMVYMTNSIENATLPKTTKPYNPKSWVQIQIRQDFEFEFVLRETKESVFFDLLDLGSITFSVESVITSQ